MKKNGRIFPAVRIVLRYIACFAIVVLVRGQSVFAEKFLIVPKEKTVHGAAASSAASSAEHINFEAAEVKAVSRIRAASTSAEFKAARDDWKDAVRDGRGRFLRSVIAKAQVAYVKKSGRVGAAGAPSAANAKNSFKAEPLDFANAIVAEFKNKADAGSVFSASEFTIIKATRITVKPPKFTVTAAADSDRVYGVGRIKAPAVWKCFETKGRGIKVAVLDSGVRATHAEFEGRVLTELGKSYTTSNQSNTDDDFGHGTHVAGTIAGKDAGVAPEANIIPFKVLDSQGRGDDVSIIQGLNDAIARDVHVINMSFGVSVVTGDPERFLTGAFAIEFRAVLKTAKDAGIVCVVAAGNDGTGKTMGIPARLEDAICVAATDRRNQVAPFSQRGNIRPAASGKPDISAPGVDIFSADFSSTTELRSDQGTSMAAPHVAGAVALMLAAARKLEKAPLAEKTLDEVRDAIKQTATDVGQSTSEVGVGLINACAATESFTGKECDCEDDGDDDDEPDDDAPTREDTILKERREAHEARQKMYDETAKRLKRTGDVIQELKKRLAKKKGNGTGENDEEADGADDDQNGPVGLGDGNRTGATSNQVRRPSAPTGATHPGPLPTSEERLRRLEDTLKVISARLKKLEDR
ncbi:MAG: S8 family serine peptidase [Planctomycetes bacterium]|nr:S8 family serine peptidase [Planctomycetota bacterium]